MRTQRYHGRRRRSPGALAAVALAAGGLALWRRWQPFRVTVEGESMAPALLAGDFLIAVHPGVRLRRGAVVVAEHPLRPGFELVKRLDHLPGETVDGRVLGQGEYWITGDDPAASTDSRAFGPVPIWAIRGVIVVRYWPPRRAGWLGQARLAAGG